MRSAVVGDLQRFGEERRRSEQNRNWLAGTLALALLLAWAFSGELFWTVGPTLAIAIVSVVIFYSTSLSSMRFVASKDGDKNAAVSTGSKGNNGRGSNTSNNASYGSNGSSTNGRKAGALSPTKLNWSPSAIPFARNVNQGLGVHSGCADDERNFDLGTSAALGEAACRDLAAAFQSPVDDRATGELVMTGSYGAGGVGGGAGGSVISDGGAEWPAYHTATASPGFVGQPSAGSYGLSEYGGYGGYGGYGIRGRSPNGPGHTGTTGATKYSHALHYSQAQTIGTLAAHAPGAAVGSSGLTVRFAPRLVNQYRTRSALSALGIQEFPDEWIEALKLALGTHLHDQLRSFDKACTEILAELAKQNTPAAPTPAPTPAPAPLQPLFGLGFGAMTPTQPVYAGMSPFGTNNATAATAATATAAPHVLMSKADLTRVRLLLELQDESQTLDSGQVLVLQQVVEMCKRIKLNNDLMRRYESAVSLFLMPDMLSREHAGKSGIFGDHGGAALGLNPFRYTGDGNERSFLRGASYGASGGAGVAATSAYGGVHVLRHMRDMAARSPDRRLRLRWSRAGMDAALGGEVLGDYGMGGAQIHDQDMAIAIFMHKCDVFSLWNTVDTHQRFSSLHYCFGGMPQLSAMLDGRYFSEGDSHAYGGSGSGAVASGSSGRRQQELHFTSSARIVLLRHAPGSQLMNVFGGVGPSSAASAPGMGGGYFMGSPPSASSSSSWLLGLSPGGSNLNAGMIGSPSLGGFPSPGMNNASQPFYPRFSVCRSEPRAEMLHVDAGRNDCFEAIIVLLLSLFIASHSGGAGSVYNIRPVNDLLMDLLNTEDIAECLAGSYGVLLR